MVVLSSSILPELRLTAEEYLQADLPEGQRYELVDGVVQMSPTPDLFHDSAVNALYQALYEYRKSHPELTAYISQRASVPIPDRQNVREPDVAVYADLLPRDQDWSAWLEFVPILVAEVVSPGQAARDYRDKRDDYWRAGVREYWVIDPAARRVTVLQRGQQQWQESAFTPDQDAVSQVLPGFSVAVSRLLH